MVRYHHALQYNILSFVYMNIVNKNANARILINTGILYFQLIFTIIVNLYATRLILNAMGVDDFGIVNLVSGIVAMLSFFQNSLTISTQRFLSVNMGKKDEYTQSQIFNTSFLIHILLGIVLVVILESILPLVFNSSIQIPIDRLTASKYLYQLTIFGTFFVIISVPYDATLNAHENMLIFSLASIIESIIRLVGAIILIGYGNDKLVFYGILLITIRFASLLFKSVYCTLHYSDAKIYINRFNWRRMREMLSFAGWNMIGGFSVSLRSQGMAVVLNIFQGVVINAAYGIANQVAGQMSNFTATITKAMAPQIMQSKGSGDVMNMKSLSLKQCKYSFLLLLFFAIPLYVEMPLVLHLWLKEIPDYCVSFCRLILLVSLAQQITIGLQTLIQAHGRIALYQTIMSLLIILNIPFAYIVLKLGFNPNYVIVAMFFAELICLFGRVLLANKLVGLSVKQVQKELFNYIFIYSFASIIIAYICLLLKPMFSEYFAFFLTIVVSWAGLLIVAALFFSEGEKLMTKRIFSNLYRRL